MSKTEIWSGENSGKLSVIVIETSIKKIQIFDIEDGMIIARDTDRSDADIDIKVDSPIVSRPDATVSRRGHGRFSKKDDYFYYEDLNSTNGTFLNGKLLGRESEDRRYFSQIVEGDVLKIDHFVKTVPHSESVIMLITRPFSGKVKINHINLEKRPSIIIGRNEGDVQLDDNFVSSIHAVFDWDWNAGGTFGVGDCGSRNGVFVNNQKINSSVHLNIWDVINIVGYPFIYTGKSILYFTDSNRDNNLIINIMEKRVDKLFYKMTILKDIRLELNAGEMVMLLGGSGAGKTTLLNAILGYDKAKGSVELGGVDIYKHYDQVKNRIAYVPQQDLLRMEETVESTMRSAAEMKLDADRDSRERRIEEILNTLHLGGKRKTVVKKLSGGERKKLSIAIELISDPTLIFFDEADSGVDGPSAKEIMEDLKNLAKTGKIILVITHSPDRIRDNFDKVIFLAKSRSDNAGRLAFFGGIDEALQFFEVDSLEDVVGKLSLERGLTDYYIDRFSNEYRRDK